MRPGVWGARLDLMYTLALPVIAMLFAYAIAPSSQASSALLMCLGACWIAAASYLGIVKRAGAALHAALGVAIVLVGAATRWQALPWALVALALAVAALALAARKSQSRSLHNALTALVLVLAALQALTALEPSVAAAFRNARFFEQLCASGLLIVAARQCSRANQQLDGVFQVHLLRAFGPAGELTIADLADMRWPTLVSPLWASMGALLTVWSRRHAARSLWIDGAALLVAAAVKLVVVDIGVRLHSLGDLTNILAVIAAGGVFLLVGWLRRCRRRRLRTNRTQWRPAARTGLEDPHGHADPNRSTTTRGRHSHVSRRAGATRKRGRARAVARTAWRADAASRCAARAPHGRVRHRSRRAGEAAFVGNAHRLVSRRARLGGKRLLPVSPILGIVSNGGAGIPVAGRLVRRAVRDVRDRAPRYDRLFFKTGRDRGVRVLRLERLVVGTDFQYRALGQRVRLLGGACVAARAGTWGGLYWLDFGERPENFFPAAALLVLTPQLVNQARFAGFAAIYRSVGLLAALLPILVLANWGRISYLPFADSTIEHLYQVLGFVVSAGSIWLGARREWPELVNTGMTFFVIFLYTKFYDWWWDLVPKFLFFLIIALTSILFLLVMKRLRAARPGVPS